MLPDPDVTVAPGAAPSRLRFAGVTLDFALGALLAPDGAEIVLRPKSHALLRLLAENAGRLVERDAIMDAVWPDVIVTDDSITQCVGEIRRALAQALGEEGPKLLRTVPRRGYLLNAAVERVGEPAPVVTAAPPAVPVLAMTATPPPPPARLRLQAVAWTGLGAVLAAALILLFVGQGDAPAPSGEAATAASPATRVPTPREEAQRLVVEGRAVARGPGNNVANWLEARTLFERAISLDPTLQAAYAEAVYTYTNVVLRGESLNPAADLRSAEALAERAVALGPGTADAHAARAAVLRHQGRYAEALAAYRQVLQIEPTWQFARANAAWMQVMLGEPEQAIAPLQALLAVVGPTNPNAPTWRTFLGFAQLYAGVGDFGVAMLRSALSVRTDVPSDVVVLHLAAALAEWGEADGARAALERLRAARPEITPDWLASRFPVSADALRDRQTRLIVALAKVWERLR